MLSLSLSLTHTHMLCFHYLHLQKAKTKGKKQANSAAMVTLNVYEVLNDLRAMGQGLVKDITVQWRKVWRTFVENTNAQQQPKERS